MRTRILFVMMPTLLLFQPVSAWPRIFRKPMDFVAVIFEEVSDIVANADDAVVPTVSPLPRIFQKAMDFEAVVFGQVSDIVTNADDAVVQAAVSSLNYVGRRCSCAGAPPYQVCGCCVTIAKDDAFGESFCVELEFSGTSIVSRLIEDGDEVATWEDLVSDLAEGISICVDILPRPSPRVTKQGCSQSGLGTLSLCLVPEVVELSFDGGVGYYELCGTLGIGLLGIFDYSLKLGCFSFGASSEDWDCVYPSTINPDQLPICHDICPDDSVNWVEQWASESAHDENLLFSRRCGAVQTDDGFCVKGCFDDLQAIPDDNKPES